MVHAEADPYNSGINYRSAEEDRFQYRHTKRSSSSSSPPSSYQQQQDRNDNNDVYYNENKYDSNIPSLRQRRNNNYHYEQHLNAGNEPLIIRDTLNHGEIHSIYENYRYTHDNHDACINLRNSNTCDIWVQEESDGCREDSLFMYYHCPVSCNVCHSLSSSEINDDDDDDHSQQQQNESLYNYYSQNYVPIRYNIPLYETFGIHEYNPMISFYNEQQQEHEYYPTLPLNGLLIHHSKSILSNGQNIIDTTTIPPQRATIFTSAILSPYDGDYIQGTGSIYYKYQRMIETKVQLVNQYLRTEVDIDEQFKLVRDKCRTVIAHTDCAIWSIPIVNAIDHNFNIIYDSDIQNTTTTLIDRCVDDWEFMKLHGCYAFCDKCEYLHIESVCMIDINEKNTFYSGDIDILFNNIVNNFNTTYNITVLSRPVKDDENHDNDGEKEVGDIEMVDGPWIIQLDDFLSEEEANIMIELGENIGYERSHQVGDLDEYGKNTDHTSNSRTSRNAWCDSEPCTDHEVVLQLFERIYNLTNIDSDHSEAIQLLQYKPGQYYHTHNDYIDYEIHRQQGVRVLTVFAYLNTLPEYEPSDDEIKPDSEYDDDDEEEDIYYDENDTSIQYTRKQYYNNGGTNFPHLNITVRPKLGRVIIWPSVLNQYPHERDERTDHRALVVTNGIKYGANFWYHQRAYVCEVDD